MRANIIVKYRYRDFSPYTNWANMKYVSSPFKQDGRWIRGRLIPLPSCLLTQKEFKKLYAELKESVEEIEESLKEALLTNNATGYVEEVVKHAIKSRLSA